MALLFAMVTLKDVASLPLDSEPATSASELQRSTPIVSARDTIANSSSKSPLAVTFVDKLGQCNKSGSGGDPGKEDAQVRGYIVNTCQKVDPTAPIIQIHWNVGFNTLKIYQDANCTRKLMNYGRTKQGQGWGEDCYNLPTNAKMLSFKGVVKSMEE